MEPDGAGTKFTWVVAIEPVGALRLPFKALAPVVKAGSAVGLRRAEVFRRPVVPLRRNCIPRGLALAISRAERNSGGRFAGVPTLTNRQILLRRRPTGLVAPEDVELVTSPAPRARRGRGAAAHHLRRDGCRRPDLAGRPAGLPSAGAVGRGHPRRRDRRGRGIALRRFCRGRRGDHADGLSGLCPHSRRHVQYARRSWPGSQLAAMSVYGPTGATAYFGMTGIGKPRAGETVVVSAAAGATGSVAGQIAKIAGARVVGIAGGPEKCRVVVEDFGFDACIDYRENNLAAALKQHCPRGVDVYFDNVGGPILDAVLGRLRTEGAGGALRRHLELPDRRSPGPGQLREPARQDRADAGLQRARRMEPVRGGLRRAAQVGGAGVCWYTGRPSWRAWSPASTGSTGCSPGPTSARCWSASATRPRINGLWAACLIAICGALVRSYPEVDNSRGSPRRIQRRIGRVRGQGLACRRPKASAQVVPGVGQAHREQAAQIQRGAAVMEPVIVLRDAAVADFAVASGEPRDRTFHHGPVSTVLVEPQRVLCSSSSLIFAVRRVVGTSASCLRSRWCSGPVGRSRRTRHRTPHCRRQ